MPAGRYLDSTDEMLSQKQMRLTLRIGFRGLMSAALAAICSSVIWAGTLADYHKRTNAAREIISELRLLDPEDNVYAGLERQYISQLRSTLPRTEKVDVPWGSIETDNVWFHDDLDLFIDQPNIDKRAELLVQIDERLAAVGRDLTTLESSTAAGPTKDDDKRKLSEILLREEYQPAAKAEESLFQRWRRELIEWLARMFPQVRIAPGVGDGLGGLSIVLQIVLYGLILAALAYVVFRLLPLFSSRFGRTRSISDDRVILGERIGSHESSVDLFAEAERLAREGDLRMAIRKGYIAVLCDLADRRLIGLARHKTNRDYLRDVRSKKELFEDLRGLTLSFETNWYGSREADEQAWSEFRERYHRAAGRA